MNINVGAHARVTDKPTAVMAEGVAWLGIGDINLFPPREDRAAWLRSLAVAAEELAEQVELAEGAALADRDMGPMRAAAGITR